MRSTTHPDGRKGLTHLGRERARGGPPRSSGTRPAAGRRLRRVGAFMLVVAALNTAVSAAELHAQQPTPAPLQSALLDAVRQSNPQLVALRAALDAEGPPSPALEPRLRPPNA